MAIHHPYSWDRVPSRSYQTWLGKSGSRIDAETCGYQTRKQQNRAERTEWEHIVPAWTFGNQRKCWKNGGREHCVDDDPVFLAMEAVLFNLYSSVGEVGVIKRPSSMAQKTINYRNYGPDIIIAQS